MIETVNVPLRTPSAVPVEPLLSARKVRKHYGGVEVLKGISVDGELIGYVQRQERIFEMNPREVARQRRGIDRVGLTDLAQSYPTQLSAGVVVESGPPANVLDNPQSPCTKAFLDSVM